MLALATPPVPCLIHPLLVMEANFLLGFSSAQLIQVRFEIFSGDRFPERVGGGVGVGREEVGGDEVRFEFGELRYWSGA